MALLDELDVPISVVALGEQTPPLSNAAWRALFGSRDVFDAIAGDTVERGASQHVAELAVDVGGPPCYVSVTRCVRSGETAHQTIIACLDTTHEVIARQLAVDAGVLVWSGQDIAVADYWNRACITYGASPPDSMHAIARDDRAACSSGLAWAIRERGLIEVEARIRRADGMYRWHQIRFVARAGSRWFATAFDIHDARELLNDRNELSMRLLAAKAEAETASRLKDQFLAAVSHELRAPLTTMVLWEGVLRNESDPVLRAKALDVIRQSALSQSRVVADLLDVSRGIAGKLHVDLRSIDLSKLVREAIEANALLAKAKSITFEHRDTAGGSDVQGDLVRLRQVLDNLVSNAIKFSEPGGKIAVTVARRSRSIVIEIRDNGCGISAAILPRLFEPFSQSESTLTRPAAGLGLGLAIAKQLVDLHGGTLSASSDGAGRGAQLTMTIPATGARRKSTPPTGVVTPNLAQTRVLVVDDERRVLDALTVLLDRAGAIVETALSAAAARDAISHVTPDVIVCDIAMPGEDGYTFMRRLRAGRSKIGAIALTAYASEHDVESALAAGFDRHLAKPVDFERLVANIDELTVARRSLFTNR